MNLQAIIVAFIVCVALFYLIYKYIIKRKKHDCDDCGFNN
ncbi:MAG: FeoB-associated Cys-rich membrane protein [Flavobacteriales bacterium]|nr:FeoB-associated Cys-rich membrane protein [Flavobacteriales bacterium]